MLLGLGILAGTLQLCGVVKFDDDMGRTLMSECQELDRRCTVKRLAAWLDSVNAVVVAETISEILWNGPCDPETASGSLSQGLRWAKGNPFLGSGLGSQ